MLIRSTFKCKNCGISFNTALQFAIYRCENCGKEYHLCPECGNKGQRCDNCGGEIIIANKLPEGFMY